MNAINRLGLLGLAMALSACSVLENDKIDYKSATKGPTLEVPPDLRQITTDARYVVPGSTVSAAAFEAGQTQRASSRTNAAPQTIGDVRIERDGNQRWLVVNRTPEQLWEPVRDFWLENGFVFTTEEPKLGLLETDWAENRAKLPQDIIRSTIGKVFDSLYSTGERDKFRTRLERGPNRIPAPPDGQAGRERAAVARHRQCAGAGRTGCAPGHRGRRPGRADG